MQMKHLLVPLTMISLSACSMQEGNFPSLAKRPFEDASTIVEPPAVPPVVSSLPGPLQAAVDKAVTQSSTAHAEFLENLPGVQRRVNAAKGAAVSSESWVVAQMDLAALEIGRGPSVTALADIDALYTERLNSEFESENSGGAAIIASKREQISAQVRRQQDEIDAMKAKLR